jgi:hypothetical protein
MTTINQIQEVMIMQMRALDPKVSVEAAKALNVLKLHLINQYHREQLIKHAERLIKPNVWQRIVFCFWVRQLRK